ncbi:globin domain-containing protein [Sandaracinus amylolyticus]|uniref:Putative bacterial hemoglobin n=1 Tax=Sandaracinus amylolyticus TaxID=927083 RepID=A0A0F6YFI6_9BACT|nr:globin domain-containing protein [Sandaracinus amylolyticus]AKF03610.1 putative bacterial hemoglobin [Sandaracinus amylolyticus]
MSLDVPLLRSSFELVLEREPALTARFYEILFERYPQARPLFARNARKQQEEMLARALAAVVDRLEDAPWLVETLGAMGAKHVDYGVTEEMYGWVGDALLRTLAEVAGDAWTPELEAAWAAAYGAIRDLMLAGASRAQAAE